MPSQHGQDRLVLQLLDGKRGGFFLDSGAADGVTASNTFMLEAEYGWTGICVEPDPRFYAALTARRRCRCVNCCLYDREGLVDFVEGGFLGGIRETCPPDHLALVERVHKRPTRVAQRPARTVRSILQAFGAPNVIDYWSLDTEGSELAILKSFPFGEYSVRVLTVEHNRTPAQQAIRQLLGRRGYRRILTLDIDDCYVLPQLLPRGGVGACPPWRSAAWSHRRR